MGEELSRRLTEHDDMLSYVFTLLGHGKTCITACQFLEDLLQARKEVLNLSTISEYLHRLIRRIGHGCGPRSLPYPCSLEYACSKKLSNVCGEIAMPVRGKK